MSWGYKIALVYSLFVIGILSMVYIASKQTIDMQEDNYYEKEIKYQAVIDAKNNLSGSNQQIVLNQGPSSIEMSLPTTTIKNIQEAKLEFFRPSNKALDFSTAFAVNDEGKAVITKDKLSKGLYKLRISWSDAQKKYYDEQTIIIN